MASALERAARAQYEAWIEDVRDLEPSWDDLPDSHRFRLVESCRAVLMVARGEAPIKAMAESRASDDEGDFAPMLDLIDFSGENKLRTVLRQAWIDGIDAILNEKDTTND